MRNFKKYLKYRKNTNSLRSIRIAAKVIDVLIVIFLTFLFFPVGIIIGVIYISLCDGFGEGQSIGKKAFGMKVISLEDGTKCSFKQSFFRNLPISIPIIFILIPILGIIFCALILIPLTVVEVYMILKSEHGLRFGDIMANTTVTSSTPTTIKNKNFNSSWYHNICLV